MGDPTKFGRLNYMVTKKKQVQEVTGATKHAILTEQQRTNLNSNAISDSLLQKLHRQLNKIFPELNEDLKIIKKSKHLLTWRSYHSIYDSDWKYYGENLSKIFSESERLYVECIISCVRKNKQRYFWIDSSDVHKKYENGVHKKPRINQRALKKDHIFHKLRYDFRNDKSNLEKAFDLKIIPYEKKDAISLKQLVMEVSKGKYKFEIPIPKTRIKKQTQTELQKFWVEIGPAWDFITRKGKKRGIMFPRKLPYYIKKNIEN